LFQNIFNQGPVFNSTNYGTLSFTRNGRFIWTGNNLLIPQIVPLTALGSGSVDMGLFLDASLENLYDGALTLRFDGTGGLGGAVRFCYTLDDQGLRIEYVPGENLDGVTVTRRSSSPTVIYFFKSGR
jgi:hypothetical protein